MSTTEPSQGHGQPHARSPLDHVTGRLKVCLERGSIFKQTQKESMDTKQEAKELPTTQHKEGNGEQRILANVEQQMLQMRQQPPTLCTALSDAEVADLARRASGGCLLRGLALKSGRWLRCSHELVNIAGNLRSVMPEFLDRILHEEFTEEEKHNSFTSLFHSTDVILDADLQVDYKLLAAAGTLDASRRNKEQKSCNGQQTGRFYSRCRILLQAVAACCLQESDLQLSESATAELRAIDAAVRIKGDAVRSIQTFFSKFGSHVTCGTIHFGGASIKDALIRCQNNEQISKLQGLVSTRLEGIASAAANLPGFEMPGCPLGQIGIQNLANSGQGSSYDHQLQQVIVNEQVIGSLFNAQDTTAPTERSRSEFAIITFDRHKIGVWTLVSRCRREFSDAAALSRALKSTWQFLTGLVAEPEIDGGCLAATVAAESFLTGLCNQVNSSGPLTLQQWEEKLSLFCEKLQAIEELAPPERRGFGWTHLQPLEEVFKALLLQHGQELHSQIGGPVKLYLRNVLELAGNCKFPMRQEIDRLLNGTSTPVRYSVLSDQNITSPHQLVSILCERVLPMVLIAVVEQSSSERKILQVVQQDLTSAARQLLKNDLAANLIFVTSLTLMTSSFRLKLGKFDRMLKWKELHELTENLDQNLQTLVKLENIEPDLIQSHLLKMFIENNEGFCDDIDAKRLLSICQNSCTSRVNQIVATFLDRKDWSSLRTEVDRLLTDCKINYSCLHVQLSVPMPKRQISNCDSSKSVTGDQLQQESNKMIANFQRQIMSQVRSLAKGEMKKSEQTKEQLETNFDDLWERSMCDLVAVLSEKQRECVGERSQLEYFKRQAFWYFLSLFKQADEEVRSADFVLSVIKDYVCKHAQLNVSQAISTTFIRKFNISRTALLKQAMESLIDSPDVDDFIMLTNDCKGFTRLWLSRMLRWNFFTADENGVTAHSNLLSRRLRESLSTVDKYVKQATGSTFNQLRSAEFPALTSNLLQLWVGHFCELIGLNADDLDTRIWENHMYTTDLDNFTQILRTKLACLEELILKEQPQDPESLKWHEKFPPDSVLENAWQGSQDCPLCGEPSSGDPYVCRSARPIGIRGFADSKKPGDLSLVTCSSAVSSKGTFTCKNTGFMCHSRPAEQIHPFRDFCTYFPQWLLPSKQKQPAAYWRWLMCTFKKDLETRHSKGVRLPKSWIRVGVEEAKKSLGYLEQALSSDGEVSPDGMWSRLAWLDGWETKTGFVIVAGIGIIVVVLVRRYM